MLRRVKPCDGQYLESSLVSGNSLASGKEVIHARDIPYTPGRDWSLPCTARNTSTCKGHSLHARDSPYTPGRDRSLPYTAGNIPTYKGHNLHAREAFYAPGRYMPGTLPTNQGCFLHAKGM